MQEPFDTRALLAELAKFNPVTAIPGMIQQGQEMVDPALQKMMQLYQQIFGQGQQVPPQQPVAPPPASPLRKKMTGSGGSY